MEGCSVGRGNESNIKDLQLKIKELEFVITHIQDNMVKSDAIHKVEIRISELSLAFEELKNNRQEDRKTMETMNSAISDLSSTMEEFIKGNSDLHANQEISQYEQTIIKNDISDIKNMIKGLARDIEKNNIWNQIKEFKSRSNFHKWIVWIASVMIIVMFFSVFTFYTGGMTFPEIMNFIKGVIF